MQTVSKMQTRKLRYLFFCRKPAKFEMGLGSRISGKFHTTKLYLWNWDEGSVPELLSRLAGILSSSNLLVGAVPVRWGKYLKMLASRE